MNANSRLIDAMFLRLRFISRFETFHLKDGRERSVLAEVCAFVRGSVLAEVAEC